MRSVTGAVISATVDVWVLVPWLAAYGIGLGMASAQLPGVILSEEPTVQSGQASGIQSTNRQVGSAFGIAVLGTVLATEIGSRTASAVRAIAGVSPATAAHVAGIVRASGGAAIDPLGMREWRATSSVRSRGVEWQRDSSTCYDATGGQLIAT